MANIALQDGKVVLKEGKVSCSCCVIPDPTCECQSGTYYSDPLYAGESPVVRDSGTNILDKCTNKIVKLKNDLVCYDGTLPDPTCECQAGGYYSTPLYAGEAPVIRNAGTNILNECTNKIVTLKNDLVCYNGTPPDPTCECQAGGYYSDPLYAGESPVVRNAGTNILNECTGEVVTLKNDLACYNGSPPDPTCECQQGDYYSQPLYAGEAPVVRTAGTNIQDKCTGEIVTLKNDLACYNGSLPDPTCECQEGDYYSQPLYAGEAPIVRDAGTNILNKCTGEVVTLKSNLSCYSGTPNPCESGSASVSASNKARTGLGITVTDAKPYLTITSSGKCDLICAEYWNGDDRPTRPNAPFSAPAQLQIYVGGTILVQDGNYNGYTALRGAVSVRIRDSGYYDNCGSYSVSGAVCPE